MKVGTLVLLIGLGVWLSGTAGTRAQSARIAKPSVTVYKSSTCGCCVKWVEHMKANGFNVTARDVEDIDVPKRSHGVPQSAASCHTAVIGGYFVEGHVPADVVLKMLREKPAIKGIAVPGMPVGSPGMEVPGYKDPYNVLSVDNAGRTAVYERR